MSKQISELKGIIGLEIHSYIITREKLFCKCKASREKGLKANTLICPICTGMPGAKPMLANEEAVRKAVMIGKMLQCKIWQDWKWQRKHYDWPDMPKGYQNTISGGVMKGIGEDGEFYGINIRSLHLEEDPASWNPETGEVDYNRSGLPLVEIITEPDFSSSEEVTIWLKRLVHALAYLKAVDSNAGIKVDVNVNLFENGKKKTERVEIKNISSIEDIGKAIEYELERQSKEGGKIRETRRYDAGKGKTEVMRSKETQDDYRFITDPDLRDVEITEKFILDLEKKLPESPEEKLEKLIKKYKIDKINAEILAKNIDIVEFFEEVVEEGKKRGLEIKYIERWVLVELLRHLNYNKKTLSEIDIKTEHFVKLLYLIKKGKITEHQGKKILDEFKEKSFDVEKKIKGKEKIGDEKELEKVIEKVLEKNKKAVEDYSKGEEKAFNYLIGQVMTLTQGRADFNVVRKLLMERLK